MEADINEALNSLDTWVSNVYGEVQSGEIDTSDLLNPEERSKILSEEESVPQAVADLTALNIPVDLDRSATISVDHDNGTVKMTGSLGSSSDSITLQSGETYDPDLLDGDVYMTYDVSKETGTWTSHKTGVDGGVVTWTSEPAERVIYQFNTAEGETAQATYSDFSDNGDGTWDADISSQLDNQITEIDGVNMYSDIEETTFETINIKQQFTIQRIETSDGTEVSSVDYEQAESHTDNNYITQSEWEQRQKRYEEAIDKFEESQGQGAAFGFLDGAGPDLSDVPGGRAGAAAAGGIGGLVVLRSLFGS
jgi:hypothetical protein